jgi:hypothetical protein
MKCILLLAFTCALTVSALPEPEVVPRDALGDQINDWAKQLYAKAEDLKTRLIAFRQQFKDRWAQDNDIKARVTSAALKVVLHALEKSMEWFKEEVVDKPEAVEETKEAVLKSLLDKIDSIISGKKPAEEVAKEVEENAATYYYY